MRSATIHGARVYRHPVPSIIVLHTSWDALIGCVAGLTWRSVGQHPDAHFQFDADLRRHPGGGAGGIGLSGGRGGVVNVGSEPAIGL